MGTSDRFYSCLGNILQVFLGGIPLIFFLPIAASASGDSAQQYLPRTGQISTFDTTGTKIDFLGTSQDGEIQRGVEWPEPRFIVNEDGTVSDLLTGLMWLKDGECFGFMNWSLAFNKVQLLNQGKGDCHDYLAKYDDWSVPEVYKLSSLINAEEPVNNKYLQLNGLSDIEADAYWSSTEYLNVQNSWTVNLGNGSIDFRNKLSKAFLLPVRVYDDERLKKLTILSTTSESGTIGADSPQLVAPTRFVDNNDGTITDTKTGLMWLKDAGCFQNIDWANSYSAVNSLNVSPLTAQCLEYQKKYDDWSVPNSLELWSLIDYSFDYPALESPYFTRIQPNYWSSTTATFLPEQALIVSMNVGSLVSHPKDTLLNVLPVRFAQPTTLLVRKSSNVVAGLDTLKEYILVLSPDLHSEIHWPTSPRFIVNDDGSSMDKVTGIYWLTDANCFGKNNWEDSIETIRNFNRKPRDFECQNYDGGYDDWVVPTLEDYQEIVNSAVDDNAVWIGTQGIDNILSSADYWTIDETLVNLYYAYVFNFKKAQAKNYSKNMKFFLWPRRRMDSNKGREPLLSLTGNGATDEISLKSGEVLSLAVFLHSFGYMYPADFWFWYETPDNKKLWLTPIRTWTHKMTPVYQRELLNLKNYEIFRSTDSVALAAGSYTFHFAVDAIQNGILDNLRYESVFVLNVEEK